MSLMTTSSAGHVSGKAMLAGTYRQATKLNGLRGSLQRASGRRFDHIVPGALNMVQLSSGLEVTNACIGTMMMGSTNTEQEAWEQLDYFREHGGNFIDTAEGYPVPIDPSHTGDSERIIGKWLKERGCRDDMVVATKVCGFIGPTLEHFRAAIRPSVDGSSVRLDRPNIMAAVDKSLERLQVSHIDLYQLHWPDRNVPLFGKYMFNPENDREAVPFEETVSTIGDLIKDGKIRAWGLSNETAYGVTMMCETAKRLGVPLPVTIQNDYSICDRAFDTENAEACNAYGVKMMPYGCLNGGFLSGKYLDGKKPEGARHTRNSKFQHRYTSPAVETALKKYKEIADECGLTLTQFCIAWVANRWHMGSVITGQTNVKQLEEYMSAFDVTLSEETLAKVDEIHKQNRNPNWSD